ncbi:MAG: AEC family transporter [Pseudoflavonifractor sp.]|nr:AEC family transporter [Pseudoflavonifractor sp.]
MENELVILQEQMVSFLTLLGIGYAFFRTGLVSETVVDAVPALVMRFVLPAMLLAKLPIAGTPEQLFHMGWVLLAIMILFAVHMLLAFLSGKLMRLQQPTLNVHAAVCGLPNSAFVGYPLLFILFPDDTALFMATYMLMDAVMLFGVAPVLLDPSGGGGKRDWRMLISPTNVCLVIALGMLLLGLKFPAPIQTTLAGIGDMSKSLGLFYIGADIARRGAGKLLRRWQLYGMLPVKLVLAPVCIFWIVRTLLPIDDKYIMMVGIMAMLPSMITVCIQAKEYGSDPEYASGGLLVTTIASMFTMPIVMSWMVRWMGSL